MYLLSFLVDKGVQQVNEVDHGFVNGSAENTRMEILRAAFNLETNQVTLFSTL